MMVLWHAIKDLLNAGCELASAVLNFFACSLRILARGLRSPFE